MREAVVCRQSHTRSKGRPYTWVIVVLATLVVICDSRTAAPGCEHHYVGFGSPMLWSGRRLEDRRCGRAKVSLVR